MNHSEFRSANLLLIFMLNAKNAPYTTITVHFLLVSRCQCLLWVIYVFISSTVTALSLVIRHSCRHCTGQDGMSGRREWTNIGESLMLVLYIYIPLCTMKWIQKDVFCKEAAERKCNTHKVTREALYLLLTLQMNSINSIIGILTLGKLGSM